MTLNYRAAPQKYGYNEVILTNCIPSPKSQFAIIFLLNAKQTKNKLQGFSDLRFVIT